MEVKSKDAFRIRGKEFPLIAPTNDQFPFFNSGTNKWEYLNLSSIGTKVINDAGSGSTDIWSASKTQTQINSAVVGLLDDRGNYTPAGNYPTTGGSGTAGAILKGDIWQIIGLGAGVSALMGTRVVFDGDWVRAVNDTPGQTDANWSESVTSSSNLGNANLVQTGNARTYTLPTGGTANQYVEFDNFGGGNLLKLRGDNNIVFGSTANGITANMYLSAVGGNEGVFNIYGENDLLAHSFRGNYGANQHAYYSQSNAAGTVGFDVATYSGIGTYMNFRCADTNAFEMRPNGGLGGLRIENNAGYSGAYSYIFTGYDFSNNTTMYLRGTQSGGYFAFGGPSTLGNYRMEIYGSTLMKGPGSTAGTSALLVRNNSDIASLEVKDDRNVVIGTSGSGSKVDFYLPTGNSGFNIYSLSGVSMLNVSSNGRYFNFAVPSGGGGGIELNVNDANNPFFRIVNNGAQFIYKPSGGAYECMNLSMNGGVPYLSMRDAADPSTVYIAGGGGHYFLDSMAIGQASAATTGYMLEVVGRIGGLYVPKTTSTTSAATLTPNADTTARFKVTALAEAATIAAPTGSPLDGQRLTIRIKDNGTARALTWNAIYRVVGTTLPTTTVLGKISVIGLEYDSADSKWDVVAVSQEA